MENSILKSTKKNLGLSESYTPFDLDVLTHLNAAFSSLNQLGIGAAAGIFVEDDSLTWEDLNIPTNQLSMVRSYVYLKVRMLFDPPGTSYLIDAMKNQIEEFEWRLTVFKDEELLAAEETP